LFTPKTFLPVVLFAALCVGFKSSAPQLPSNVSNSLSARSALRNIASSGRLSELRWPDFSDYRTHVMNFYAVTDYGLVWVHDNQPTREAQEAVQVLSQADRKGLKAEDYDGPRWSERIASLQKSSLPEEQAHFDAALTVCLMRYVSDLHIGKVNPRHFKFNLDVGPKKYDLPSFLREKLINSSNVQAELEQVEPPFAGYRRTQEALQHYLDLMAQKDEGPLSIPAKAVEAGAEYTDASRLARRLQLLGDLSSADADSENTARYAGALVTAVKHFQERHGLAPDGRLGVETLKQLNTPLTFRVEQLRLTLERWRWVPYEFKQPPIVVNIPEFRLRAYDSTGSVGFESNVIVGKSYRHQTPVFEREMKFVVFRPYWNVPPSIQRSEIVPAIKKDRDYIAKRNYEVVTTHGALVTSGSINDDVLQQLSGGRLSVRQKPGPSNALGLVKLMFPNEYNVYLHSTPTQGLFSQSRRDFSHGCIRVEKAAELAAWVLRDKPEWTLDRVRTTMQDGKDNQQINLTTPQPVLILYGTAVVDNLGQVHFFNDIYGHDAALEKALARGYPYPS
jgi:murein L,D-transpeptidase YcbB/YkuD